MIHWRWLILALSIGFQVGLFVQHRLDKRVHAVMQNTIDDYELIFDHLINRPSRKTQREQETNIDAAKRIV